MSGTKIARHQVQHGLLHADVYGIRLSHVSTETAAAPRWLEMTLYREWDVKRDGNDHPVMDDDGTAAVPVSPLGYVLHLVGRSVVYHDTGSDCNTGVTTAAVDLPGDAEPCATCGPPPLEELGDLALVDLEEDRHTTHRLDTADGVLMQLARQKPGQPFTGRLSAPAQRLIQNAARLDDALRETVRISGPLVL